MLSFVCLLWFGFFCEVFFFTTIGESPYRKLLKPKRATFFKSTKTI